MDLCTVCAFWGLDGKPEEGKDGKERGIVRIGGCGLRVHGLWLGSGWYEVGCEYIFHELEDSFARIS